MHLLVTAGPTREYFDSVRFVSNASSGKMGYAIAAEAARRGHQVVLVSGPVDLPSPQHVHTVRVTSAAEMLEEAVERFSACDAAVMAAAVCDERPVQCGHLKSPKPAAPRSIEFAPTEDICARLGRIKGRRVLIGFALEDQDGPGRAEAKLERKHCDAIVLNHPDTAGADEASVQFFRPGIGWSNPLSGPKPMVAEAIVDLLETIRGAAQA